MQPISRQVHQRRQLYTEILVNFFAIEVYVF